MEKKTLHTAKALLITITALLAACGSTSPPEPQGLRNGSTAYFNYSSSSPKTYYNAGETYVFATISSAVGAKTTAKTAEKIEVGDILTPGMVQVQSANYTISGCKDGIPGSQVRVCYTAGNAFPAQVLSSFLPDILNALRGFIGDPGQVDIVITDPSTNKYGGEYDPPTHTAVITMPEPSSWTYILIAEAAAHELTHAAYFGIRGRIDPIWLNEGLATYAETLAFNTPRQDAFDGGDLSMTPTTAGGYARVQSTSLFLHELSPTWTPEVLRQALTSSDPVQSLTGLDMSTFCRLYWRHNQSLLPAVASGTRLLAPHEAISISGRISVTRQLETL